MLENFEATIIDLLLDNRTVTTPLCNFNASIKGHFYGDNDLFDPNRHRIAANASPGTRLKHAFRRATAHKVTAPAVLPALKSFIDAATGQRNGCITPGGTGSVTGSRLKFDRDDAAQGIFFLSEDGSTTRMTDVAFNKPGCVIFGIPQLPAGRYTLKLKTRMISSTLLESKLAHTLQVD